MNWFKKMVVRWVRDDWENSAKVSRPETLTARDSDGPDTDRCLNFRVWFANGGKVVQTNRYDRIKDRNQTSMYVITEDQDFGREIDKIVTMDSLRG